MAPLGDHLPFTTKEITNITRMHSSRMRTGRSLTVCCSLLPGGVCLVQGGSPCWGGLPAGGGGSSLAGGFCLVRGGGGFLPGGGVLPAGGGLPGLGGALAQGVLFLPARRSPPCEQNHTHV